MTTFVMVHGTLHGSWCWKPILARLRAVGHTTIAVDLPGRHGNDGADLRSYVHVVDLAVERAEPPVVLVGHSIGGAIASQSLENKPDAVAGLVLVNALIPGDGESALQKLQTAGQDSFFMRPGVLHFADDGSTVSVTAADAVQGFYNRCSTENGEWAAARLCPEPVPPLTAPVHLSDARFGVVPKIYLGAREDRTVPWWMQQEMSTAAGARFIELTGDHSPFLSVPHEFVAHLIDIERAWC